MELRAEGLFVIGLVTVSLHLRRIPHGELHPTSRSWEPASGWFIKSMKYSSASVDDSVLFFTQIFYCKPSLHHFSVTRLCFLSWCIFSIFHQLLPWNAFFRHSTSFLLQIGLHSWHTLFIEFYKYKERERETRVCRSQSGRAWEHYTNLKINLSWLAHDFHALRITFPVISLYVEPDLSIHSNANSKRAKIWKLLYSLTQALQTVGAR